MLWVVMVSVVTAGEPPVVPTLHTLQPQAHLTEIAHAQVDQQLEVKTVEGNVTGCNSTADLPGVIQFKDTAGCVLASLALAGNITVDLRKTMCSVPLRDNKCCAGPGGTGDKCIPGMVIPDMTSLTSFPLFGNMAASAVAREIPSPTNATSSTRTELTLTLAYTDLKYNTTAHPALVLAGAAVVLVVDTRGEVRADYWNLTSATLTLDGTNDSTKLPASSDITPKSGYSWAEPACTAPYSPCAPTSLSWTCTDQVLAPTQRVINTTHFSTNGTSTPAIHLPGMALLLGGAKLNSTFNWDCDPLIPMSVWVSVLISLFLASLLMWGICMLATVNGPTQFDDPKGPGIYVPNAD